MSAITRLQGDCRDVLATLPAGHFQLCVTSPPYFGLRRYMVDGHPDAAREIGQEARIDCAGYATDRPCGECYICALLSVFGGRAANNGVWRGLRGDGLLYVNIGDSYANDSKWGGATGGKHTDGLHGASGIGRRKQTTGIAEKSLCLVPQRFALAMQAAGWTVRDQIVWHKPNAMPSSTDDRCTPAWEPVYMFSKSPRYFYDAVAVSEPAATGAWGAMPPIGGVLDAADGGGNGSAAYSGNRPPGSGRRNRRNVWAIPTAPFGGAHFAVYPPKLIEPMVLAGTSARGACPECGRPWARQVSRVKAVRRDVEAQRAVQGAGHYIDTVTTTGWEPACGCDTSESFRPDDFEDVLTPTGLRAADDPSLLTGRASMNRPRGAKEGQRPITRYEQRRYAEQMRLSCHAPQMREEAGASFSHYVRSDRSGARPVPPELLARWIAAGWLSPVAPPERHPHRPVPCRVLDPFGGSGTTACVAAEHGRDCTLIELNPNYLGDIAGRRLKGVQPRLNLEAA